MARKENVADYEIIAIKIGTIENGQRACSRTTM
jgi:hypothetical protein